LAQLSITRNGRLEGVFYLPDRPVVVGRADGVDIQLLDSRVSRRHSVIRQSVAGFMIQDLNTKNGTYVNKEAVEKSLLFHGDTVVIGGYTLHFLEEEGVEDLDSMQISSIDNSKGLNLPPKLKADVSPRTHTAADPAGPPAHRTNRLNRKPPPKSRSKGPIMESNTQVPVVEAFAEDESFSPGARSGGIGHFVGGSEIDILIEDEPAPDPGKRGTTAGLPRKALGELVEHVHALDTPMIEEIDGDLTFEVRKGTTTLGSTDREDVKIASGGLVKGLLATLERDGHQVSIRPESVLRTIRVNGQRIPEKQRLKPGDVFELAGRRFLFGQNQLKARDDLDQLDDLLRG
jgi:pSer/pThr/pTyr-binding forkhead associated (FHA) protein